ncbi:hypothetical protein Tco_1160829 [Tanacetum coccineum]
MKRISKGYSEVDIQLFLTMISAPETSPSIITFSPSLSPQHTPVSTSSTSQPPNTQPTPTAEEAVPMPQESPLHNVHSLRRDEGSVSLNELMDLCTSLSKKVGALENELQQTKKTYSTAITKLILKVKKLEQKVKTTKARRKDRIVLSEDVDDSSKQGRKISEIDTDPSISLVQDEGPSWFWKIRVVVKKVKKKLELLEQNIVLSFLKRSAEKKNDKGKGIMTEPEPKKKTKKQLEQERLRHEEAVRLQEQLNEEEIQKIARDAEIAKQLQEEINKATQEQENQEVVTEVDPTHVIDWSDPVVLRYHAQLNRPYSVAEVRKNMVMYLKNQGGYKMNYFKGMNSEKKGSRKKSLARKRAGEKQSEESTKRQKIEDDIEKEELKAYLDLFPREEFATEIESLDTKYPIVNWKTHVLTENFMYYQIIRADGGSKNYKIFSEMLDDFDRQDVTDLHRLVEERYATSRPEGYDLMLWGDMKILFQPEEEDEVWRHQHEYNLISWRLFDSCGIHILLMDNGIAIHMMIEKKYPLTQEMLSKMLSRKLEVDHESTMSYELLRFIRSQVQK